MVARVFSWWQKTRKPIDVIGLIVMLVVAIALIFVEVRVYGTGFKGKTLWDWLQLLIIPAILTLGAVWFTARQNHDLHITLDNQRETVLQTYLDKMSELILHENSMFALFGKGVAGKDTMWYQTGE